MVYLHADSLHPAMAVDPICSATVELVAEFDFHLLGVTEVVGHFVDIHCISHAACLEDR